jgi:hypothetical protein
MPALGIDIEPTTQTKHQGITIGLLVVIDPQLCSPLRADCGFGMGAKDGGRLLRESESRYKRISVRIQNRLLNRKNIQEAALNQGNNLNNVNLPLIKNAEVVLFRHTASMQVRKA